MARLTEEELTPELIAFAKFMEREEVPPTVRDFQLEVGLSSTSVANYHLKAMAELGWLTQRTPLGAARSWRLTDFGYVLAQGVSRTRAAS